MTRLIDADELTAQIVGMAMDKAVVYGNAAIKGSKEIFALAMVTQAPTIDAVPVKRGMWTFIRLTDKDYGNKAKECSSCGSVFFDTRQWAYCHNCGADMRGEE